jgi:hypothetical protein
MPIRRVSRHDNAPRFGTNHEPGATIAGVKQGSTPTWGDSGEAHYGGHRDSLPGQAADPPWRKSTDLVPHEFLLVLGNVTTWSLMHF